MPLLVLIRHGENEYSKKGRLAGRLPGVHLNERGLKQAEELAEALREAPIRALYSSPLERAIETANPIGKVLRLEVRRVAGLMEADVGEWQGRSLRQLALRKSWRAFHQAPSRARHPAGESMLETQVRIVSTLEALCGRHRRRDMLACVSHADPIKMAVAHFIGLPLDGIQSLACDTASVTMLAIGSTSARLVWLNQHPPFDFRTSQLGH